MGRLVDYGNATLEDFIRATEVYRPFPMDEERLRAFQAVWDDVGPEPDTLVYKAELQRLVRQRLRWQAEGKE